MNTDNQFLEIISLKLLKLSTDVAQIHGMINAARMRDSLDITDVVTSYTELRKINAGIAIIDKTINGAISKVKNEKK